MAVDAAPPPEDLAVRLVAARLVRVEVGVERPSGRRSFGIVAAPRGAARDAYPLPLPQMDDNMTFGRVDVRGVTAIPLPPGDWTLSAIGEGGAVLATTDVTVPATGDDPVRVTLPVK
jgi:hypothetical protein